ncbi:sigma-70 family RNA polymerase sigma factor [Geodermatophilus sp. DSM 44513]|uniref:sigma-70 family RNA polymerase sigma factor n=1 Tax=Geodermatophilus sp. DSM 44513 TaxID=1528104 RepID=UPI0012880F2B|nr:sigma-70 family RNA polymerase sigma factor [Geodermatophilus sp. DSM 44513]WNV77848.1 sigma-70 family RNA polymerase sigma factor [Geodermatophilus sp. DSM 44513]
MGLVSSLARRVGDGPAGADLVLRIRAGDRTAVDELYDRYSRPAFTLARRILADEVLAEDVVQDVFLSVWRDPGAFDAARGSFSSWLMAMVHHKAVDAVRREESQRRRQARAEDELALSAPTATGDVEDDAWSRVVSEQVRGALGSLPAAQREALTLAYYGGYTQREVAALTSTPLGTVKTRMLAGMRRLREELGDAAGAARSGALGGSAPADGTSR